MNTRNTVQKQMILSAVKDLRTHPSADEIYAEVVKAHPSVSKATVYRNLGMMAESGEIRRVEVPNAPDRFDFKTERHEHLKCRVCGCVYDVTVPPPPMPSESDGVRAEGYSLLYRGVCRRCRQKQEGEDSDGQ